MLVDQRACLCLGKCLPFSPLDTTDSSEVSFPSLLSQSSGRKNEKRSNQYVTVLIVKEEGEGRRVGGGD